MRYEVFLVLALLVLTSCQGTGFGTNQTGLKDYSRIDPVTGEVIPIKNSTFNLSIPTVKPVFIPVFNRTLRIASFNSEEFGVTKLENKPVITAMGEVLDDYDIIAFQEVVDESQTAFPKFIRENMPYYDYVISGRAGRDKHKEQMAFIYHKFVRLKEVITYPDENDYFEREPLIGFFQIETYDFILIQVHINPDDAQQETNHLKEVVDYARLYFEDNDVIILGSMYADNPYYTPGTALQGYNWLIPDNADTTSTLDHVSYDRIIITPSFYGLLGGCGVDDFSEKLNYDYDLVRAVSGHYAVFCVLEV
jgi:hypothetical protein